MTCLLRDLPSLYPGAEEWLQRRMDEVSHGLASGLVATTTDGIAGLTILTPKSPRTLKLSTILVARPYRSRGIGASLLTATLAAARDSGYSEVYVTVAHHLVAQLSPLLARNSFTMTAREPNRYGPGRHEVVFTALLT